MTSSLEMLNPADLLVDVNVRADLGLDAAFIDSIRTLGVLVPVVALRSPDGVRVRAGHRRTVAAVEAGLDHIPVMVLDASGDTTADEQERIVEQLAENTQRAPLATSDVIAAVEQLSLLGVSPTAIAKATSLPKQDVTHALAAAGSPTAIEAVDERPALTLEHAMWLAEFEDAPGLREDLLDEFTGDPGRDRHAVERARDQLRTDLARQALADRISEETGARLYTGDYYNDDDTKLLKWLAATPQGPAITPEEHQGCPGHAFTLHNRSWPEPDEVQDNIGFQIDWLCDDYEKHGHHNTGPILTPHRQQDETGSETKTEERRRTIALNRAGDAALKVRREWLTEFTTRKSSPKTGPAFLWIGLALGHVAASHDADRGMHKVSEILHIPSALKQRAAFDTWIAGQTQARLAHLQLCARLWSYEDRCEKTIWQRRSVSDYLRALESWGYTLSDVEKVATGDLTEDQAHTAAGEV